jgi:5-methylcytosine-specific restriction endonuclease McrA
MQAELDFLTGLGVEQLHAEGCTRSKRLAGAEWSMAMCLLAVEKTQTYWARGYSSTVQYAVTELTLDRHKAAELLRAATVLEYLPLMSEAVRLGEVCWSKLREITRVVTPSTERYWLDFAKAHTAEHVARAVVLTPTEFKRQQAAERQRQAEESQLTFDHVSLSQAPPQGKIEQTHESPSHPASIENHSMRQPVEPKFAVEPASNAVEVAGTKEPTAVAAVKTAPASDAAVAVKSVPASDTAATVALPATDAAAAVKTMLEPDAAEAIKPTELRQAPAPGTASTPALSGSGPLPPDVPKLVGVHLRLTPDEYAIVEQAIAERRRRRGGRPGRRETAIVEVCEAFLASTPPSGRLKSQVVVHTSDDGQTAWYETDRGVLPATKPHQQPVAQTQSRPQVQLPPQEQPAKQPHSAPLQNATRSSVNEQPPASTVNVRKRTRRPAIPQAIVKAVRARANGRCESPNCGRAGRLHFHHIVPVSDGGTHSVDNICQLCHACHARWHEPDFAQRPEWRAFRERAIVALTTTTTDAGDSS